jgi:hypothetical protein
MFFHDEPAILKVFYFAFLKIFTNSIHVTLTNAVAIHSAIIVREIDASRNSCCKNGTYIKAAMNNKVMPVINGTRLFLYRMVDKGKKHIAKEQCDENNCSYQLVIAPLLQIKIANPQATGCDH